MGVAIVFRKTNTSVPFQKVMECVAELNGETYVLSSGYFSINNAPANIMIPAIQRGFNGLTGTSFYLIGGMFNDSNNRYKFQNLVNHCTNSGLTPIVRTAVNNSYHAKLAFKLRDGKPIAVVAGSSNFSLPAFIQNQSLWSHECDVVIWRESIGNILQNITFQQGERMLLQTIEPSEDEILDGLWNDLVNLIDNNNIFSNGE